MKKKVKVKKYEIYHFDDLGTWESIETISHKSGLEPVFEIERGNMFQIKDAAIRLISRDKFHGRHNWKIVMVMFSGKGALVTRSEYDAAVKVN
jgi:hypothetical protein